MVQNDATAVEVIDQDKDANTITVDGGKWDDGSIEPYGANQSVYGYSSSVPDVPENSDGWSQVFSDHRYTTGNPTGYMQWKGQDAGTTGTGIAALDAAGSAGVVFDPPLTGAFKVMCNFSRNSTGVFVMDGSPTLLLILFLKTDELNTMTSVMSPT